MNAAHGHDIPAPLAPGSMSLDHIHGADGERDLGQAVWRGWRRRCPACGTGPTMKGYLQVRPTCTVCGEELHHHRADDGPAWLTMLVVGHLMAPILGWAFIKFRPDPMVLTAVFGIGAVALSLWLLPRIKGMMIGFQWAKRMHGFAPTPDAPDLSEP